MDYGKPEKNSEKMVLSCSIILPIGQEAGTVNRMFFSSVPAHQMYT